MHSISIFKFKILNLSSYPTEQALKLNLSMEDVVKMYVKLKEMIDQFKK